MSKFGLVLLLVGAALACVSCGQRRVALSPPSTTGARIRRPLDDALISKAARVDELRTALVTGADPNKMTGAAEHAGWTPLHMAVALNRPDLLLELLKFGANPNIEDPKGSPPLLYAAFTAEPDSVAYLLSAGANLKTKAGRDLVEYARKGYKSNPNEDHKKVLDEMEAAQRKRG